jgi:probable F420-dependent oxidoreductase
MGRRKFRFGVQNNGSTLEDWQQFVRKAEDMGFSVIVMQDHFVPQLSPLPALMAAAYLTTDIRLGTLVLDNDFRHPALMAKEAATVDALTGGRLELGLGAGWMLTDYSKLNLPFEAPATRFERMRETVAIAKAFFTEEVVNYKGKHYQVEGLEASPKSPQKPHPPLLIGGRQKRMLSFAAREADIVSISMLDRRTPDGPPPPTFAEKVGWVRAAAGERFDQIEIHANASNFEITDNVQASVERIAGRMQIPEEDVWKSPANLIGSVDAVVEQMQAWQERCNLSYINVQARLMDMMAPVIARLR